LQYANVTAVTKQRPQSPRQQFDLLFLVLLTHSHLLVSSWKWSFWLGICSSIFRFINQQVNNKYHFQTFKTS